MALKPRRWGWFKLTSGTTYYCGVLRVEFNIETPSLSNKLLPY